MRGLLLMTLLGLAACAPGGGRDCRCILCDEFAVNLEVVDEAGDPIENFVVETVFNGQPSGEPENCTVDAREGSNRCGLGAETGYYHLIITAGGFEQLELAARGERRGRRYLLRLMRACARRPRDHAGARRMNDGQGLPEL